jgi:hypothetical protein
MFTIHTKWFLDKPHVIRQIGKGKAKALRQTGAMVYRSVQGEFRSDRASSIGSNRQIGTYKGLPLIERRKRKGSGGKITSWKSPRNQKGFMRSSIAFAWDSSTKTVVVGPRRMQSAYSPTLNTLHEKGGSQTQRMYLRFRGRPIPLQRTYGLRRRGNAVRLAYVGTFMSPRPTTSNFKAIARFRTVRTKASRYQAGGLRKVMAKIPRQFKDKISGP